MRRKAAAWASALVVAIAAPRVGSAFDDPPPLDAPAGTPPIVEAPAAPPARPVPNPLRPASRPARPGLPRLEPIGPGSDLPPLTVPSDPAAPEPSPLPLDAGPPGRTLTLESTSTGELEALEAAKRRLKSRDVAAEEPAPPSPPRRFRLFGRFQPAPAARTPARESKPARDSISVEPRSDPAADAALKRRLETQIRAAAGRQLRSLEVRVVDRNVSIRARADRFWHRRSLRHTIENLPALAGYKADVEVTE